MADGISMNVNSITNYRNVENNLKAEDREDKKLKQACDDFESMLLGQMLKSMRQSVPEDTLFGSSNEKEIFQSMFDQEISTQISRSEKSLGIGDQLYNELKEAKNPKNVNVDPVKASFQREKP
jgi:flagellar protein FlgJ